jgi:hypothetical protein
MARSAQVEGNHDMPFGEQWHNLAPFPPSLRKAMEKNERRSIATDDSRNPYVAYVKHLVTKVV